MWRRAAAAWLPQASLHAAVVTPRDLPFEEQREPLLEGEIVSRRPGALLFERGGHARESEFVQASESLLDQHGVTYSSLL